MRVHLGGHLNWYEPQKQSRLEIHLAAPIALRELVDQLGLPPAEIYLVSINGEVASIDDALIYDSDRVDFFPPVGGG